ncbi:MAG: glycerol-3-phosphate 1-O-acyltransferase PlsY [Oscillospiraceae bacterium]|jgi:glycerol-3-phosphate acyltransferase PlsY|nr:glycerol-3-phosphate 1-O-acyltransferase PlsY [Oscillospiraceae bacterium]
MSMLFLRLLLCAVIGYLLGNIQTGLIIGRLSQNIDLRKHGSGSSGATNALRVLGSQSALFTLLGDFAKGLLATLVGLIITGWQGGMAGALFVVLGHIWPALFNFHGGKGVATSIGALVILLPWHTLLLLAVGIALIWATKMVSLGSVCGALVFLISSVITAIVRADWFMLVFCVLMSGLVLYAHQANIDRLLRGTENKLSHAMFRKKK